MSANTRFGCPDCGAALRGDGSCCDRCGWVLIGGGDDPRRPSERSADDVRRAIAQREIADAKRNSPIPINPKLPRNFDSTPNDERPHSHARWWGRPYIQTETVWRLDDQYAGRTDEYADGARQYWAENRAKWLEAWPSGVRWNVRCLDGGAWDRSTSWGMFATLAAALECAGSPVTLYSLPGD